MVRNVKEIKAKDIMVKDVLSVNKNWPIERLSDFFIQNSISGASVVSDEGKLVGVVSMSDIVRNKSVKLNETNQGDPHDYFLTPLDRQFAEEEIVLLQVNTPSKILVKDIMTDIIFQVEEETPIQKVANLMINGHIHRVFVTRDGKQIGIITALDMIKIISEM